MGSRYGETYAQWRADPLGFWAKAAEGIDWIRPPKTIFDAEAGVYGRWFPDATLNACFNAVDRHVAGGRGDQAAIYYDSPVTRSKRRITYRELQDEVATLAAALIGLGVLAWRNAVANMQARGVPMGFGFWDETAGFDVNQKLIPFSALSTYGRAFWVGLLNTLLVGAVSIALATPLGFAVGLARLAPNWLLSRLALVYVELTRNTPLLLQLFFWYNAVLKTLPPPRQSLSVAGAIFLNNRGLYLPRPTFEDGAWLVGAALAWSVYTRMKAQQDAQAQFNEYQTSAGHALTRTAH